MLAILDGRNKSTIAGFLRSIPIGLQKTIVAACVDMYEGYINAVKEVFKNEVMIVVDRYHVAKLYRRELDKFRQKILNQLKQELTEQEYRQIISATKVGSRTGALALGSGGNSPTFVVALSPVTIATFPIPAASNAACGFPALRFLDSFLLKFM